MKAVGHLEQQMRALWIDLFMELDMATKKSGYLVQPVEKIRFQIFKTLSWLQICKQLLEGKT